MHLKDLIPQEGGQYSYSKRQVDSHADASPAYPVLRNPVNAGCTITMVANHMVFLADGPHILLVLLVIGSLGFGALQIIHI